MNVLRDLEIMSCHRTEVTGLPETSSQTASNTKVQAYIPSILEFSLFHAAWVQAISHVIYATSKSKISQPRTSLPGIANFADEISTFNSDIKYLLAK